MRWKCIKSCVWGTEPKMVKFWKVGEEVVQPTRPNHHFINVDKIEEEFKFEEKEKADIRADDLALMTKSQINEKFNLGYSKSEMNRRKKEQLITEAIRSTTNVKRS